MKLSRTIAISAALLTFTTSAAQAADFMGIVQGLAGKYVISWEDLDTRRADLSLQIDEAVKSGQLTRTQAKDFRDALDKLAQEETQAKAGGKRMSIVQSMQFSNQLSSLANALQQAATTTVTTLPDVDALRAQLATQVDQSVASGQMSAATATTLRAQLQRVADIEAAYKAETGGQLTARQIELLSDELNKAKADIDQQVKMAQSAIPALNDKRAAVEARITAALTDRRITAADATAFRQQLTEIAAEQTQFQNLGGGTLTGTQVLRIAQRLDGVDNAVSAKIAVTPGHLPPSGGPSTLPPATTVSTREIERMVDYTNDKLRSAIAQNKLSAQSAARMTHQIDQLRMQVTQLGTTGATQDDVDEVRSRLRQFNMRLERAMAMADRPQDDDLPPTGPGTDIGMGPGPGAGPGPGSIPVNVGGGTTTGGIGSLPVINNEPLTDIRGYWGEQYVAELSSRGVIGGFPDGSFKPNDEITRAQFAAIVARALKLEPMPQSANFGDVPRNYWGAGVIGAAVNSGLITGFPDGSYRPEDKITRAQALVILSKALPGASADMRLLSSYSDANSVPSWAQKNVAVAASARIIANFPDASQIRPNAYATRGEVAALMYQTLNALGANLPPLRVGVLPR